MIVFLYMIVWGIFGTNDMIFLLYINLALVHRVAFTTKMDIPSKDKQHHVLNGEMDKTRKNKSL